MISTLIKNNFKNKQVITTQEIVKFTNDFSDLLGFYLFEVVDYDTGRWSIEARFPHPRNSIYGEIIIDKDVISPRTTLNQRELLNKIEYLQNLYAQYQKENMDNLQKGY